MGSIERSCGVRHNEVACALFLLFLALLAVRPLAIVAARPSLTAHDFKVDVASDSNNANAQLQLARRGLTGLRDEDLVIATAAPLGPRLLLTHASRSWRGDVRTLIAINGSKEDAERLTKQYSEAYNEWYEWAPDDGEGYWGSEAHHNYAGDPRSALSPILAHRVFKGQYKWILYGDDDTLFFLPAAKKLLEKFDHNEMHAISDRIYYDHKCLPCFFDPEDPPTGDIHGLGPSPAAVKEGLSFKKACPVCNVSLFCSGGQAWCPGGVPFYGGGGVIFSKALVEHLDTNNMYQECIKAEQRGGSDGITSSCLWKAGISFTDPGYIAAHNNNEDYRVFMPEWHNQFSHNESPLSRLVMGKCDYLCKWRILNQVSAHAKARSLPSPERAAAMIVSLHAQNDAAVSLLEAITAVTEDDGLKLDGVDIHSWPKTEEEKKKEAEG